MKKVNQTELVNKLATLPMWDAATRRQLRADFAAYIPLVSTLISPAERKALAVDLPAMWKPNQPFTPTVERLMRMQTWQIVQSFSDLHMVALFILLMDERERFQNAMAAASPCTPVVRSVGLADDLPF